MKHRFFPMIIAVVGLFSSSCTTNNWGPDFGGDFPPSMDPGNGNGGIGGGTDDTSAPEFDPTIKAYEGQKATDGDQDQIGTDADFYHELNDFSKVVSIKYNGKEAEVTSTSDKVLWHKDGAHVVVDLQTNTVSNVNIELSGTTPDGSLKVYGAKKFLLTLNNANITSAKGPAINSQCKKRVFVYLKPNTENSLCDASSYSDDIYYLEGNTSETEDRKGCFFSEGNMIFSGTGVLKVAGKKKHGIVTDGYFYMRPGVTIAVTEAAKNAVHVKGDTDDQIGVTIEGGLLYTNVSSDAGKGIKTDMMVQINGGELQLNTSGKSIYDEEEKDSSSPSCIKADGNVCINGGTLTLKSTGTGGKGISADTDILFAGGVTTITTTGGKYYYNNNITSSPKGVKADGNVTIEGGKLNISVTGVSDGSEGLESKAVMTIKGGETYVFAYDDAINAGKALNIEGGKVFCHSQKNDGIDSNGTLTISGGLIISSGATSPEESFDSDNSSNFSVKGGIIIGIAGGCTSPGSGTTQNCVLYGGLSATKDSNIAVLDSNGKVVVAYKLHRSLSGLALFVSSPSLAKAKYTISAGGKIEGATSTWNGYYDGGTWSGGSQVGSFTVSSTVTTVGVNTGGMGWGPR